MASFAIRAPLRANGPFREDESHGESRTAQFHLPRYSREGAEVREGGLYHGAIGTGQDQSPPEPFLLPFPTPSFKPTLSATSLSSL